MIIPCGTASNIPCGTASNIPCRTVSKIIVLNNQMIILK